MLYDGNYQEISKILSRIRKWKKEGESFLVAVDGRCAAGKTTLAGELSKCLAKGEWLCAAGNDCFQKAEGTEAVSQAVSGCGIFHMDDFFLRPGQRTAARYEEPGGNVDRERFLKEVLLPLRRGESFAYRPYSCRSQGLRDPVLAQPTPVSIIEGSYSCHPALWDYYDLHIFMDIEPEEQLRRIRQRNGEEAAAVFMEKWIPLEEKYFAAYDIQSRCEMCL